MGPSPYRHARIILAFAALLGAVALLGSQRASAGGAVTMQSDFAGLVDIGGGRRLYLECWGQGSRLLEPGSHRPREQSADGHARRRRLHPRLRL
jgi:hypothetical protein